MNADPIVGKEVVVYDFIIEVRLSKVLKVVYWSTKVVYVRTVWLGTIKVWIVRITDDGI